MPSMPLVLKIKGDSQEAPFQVTSAHTISYDDQNYEFLSVCHNSIPANLLHDYTKTSATLVLMGPTGSGKTTSLYEILSYFVNLGSNAVVTACEVDKNSTFVDLLDGNASKKYLSTIPFDNQLKKRPLEPRVVAKLMKDRLAAATACNAHSSRSCLLVNIYKDSKLLTVVDMMGNEKFDAASSNAMANTNVSSLTHHLLAGPLVGRSHNLVTNMIFRRVSSLNILFIMHLDSKGDVALIKSSLVNLSQAVKVFRQSDPRTAGFSLPHKQASSIPNYAKPTVSSGAPLKTLSSFKVEKPAAKKKRLNPSPDASNSPRPISRRLVLLKHTSPRSFDLSKESSKLMKLEENAALLRRQLLESKTLHAGLVRGLQNEVRSIKEGVLGQLRHDLLAAHNNLENLVSFSNQQGTIMDAMKEQISHLQQEKTQSDAELEQMRGMFHEKIQEIAQLTEASAADKAAWNGQLESQLSQKQADCDALNEDIFSLTNLHEEAMLKNTQLLKQVDEMEKEKSCLNGKLTNALDTIKVSEERIKELQSLAASKEQLLNDTQADLIEQTALVESLKQQLGANQELLAGQAARIKEQTMFNDQNRETIATLEEAEKVSSQKIANLESEKNEAAMEQEKSTKEIEKLTALVHEMTKKCDLLQQANQARIDENKALELDVCEKIKELSNARGYKDKCATLEMQTEGLKKNTEELERKMQKQVEQHETDTRNREAEHEKHVIRLNEELGKVKGFASSPKKPLDYPDMDFHNGNATFSSIDIFEDQTEYMNFFRRPVTGQSPTRVLAESNIKANTSPGKVKTKPAMIEHQLELGQEIGQENNQIR